MTGKAIDSSATTLLILILPLAVLIVLLLQAWPALLALLVLSVSWKIWQQYQWKQWSRKVTPHFNQLVKENQGCLTPLDLSIKANLSGPAAQQFLDRKAEEFGAQRRDYEDKGSVYYFLTASALGSIFEDSEPPRELESVELTGQAPKLFEAPLQKELPSESESSTSDLPKPPEPRVEEQPSSLENESSTADVEATVELPEQKQPTESPNDKGDWQAEPPDETSKASHALIQAELAKRLEVHSSTVGKRKSDPDFPEWSQGRDPEGIAWKYSPDTKEFFPLERK